MRSRADPITEISVFATELSVTRMTIFPYEYFSPAGYPERNFLDNWIASRSQHCGQNGIIVLYVFLLRGMRISLISKVKRVHKAATAANDKSYVPPF